MVLQATWMDAMGSRLRHRCLTCTRLAACLLLACSVQVKLEAVTSRVSVAEGGWAEAGGRLVVGTRPFSSIWDVASSYLPGWSPHELLAMATAVGAASLPIRATSGPLQENRGLSSK